MDGEPHRERGVAAIEYGVMILLVVLAFYLSLGLVGSAINGMLVQVANAF